MVAGDRDPPRSLAVFVLAVAPPGRRKVPSFGLDHPDDISDSHSSQFRSLHRSIRISMNLPRGGGRRGPARQALGPFPPLSPPAPFTQRTRDGDPPGMIAGAAALRLHFMGKDREPGRQRIPAMPPSPPDPSLPAKLREFHQRLPLAGTPPNAPLSLPDDRLLYLAAPARHAGTRWRRGGSSATTSHHTGSSPARVPAPGRAGGLPIAVRGHGVAEPGISLCGRCGPAGPSNSNILPRVVLSLSRGIRGRWLDRPAVSRCSTGAIQMGVQYNDQ